MTIGVWHRTSTAIMQRLVRRRLRFYVSLASYHESGMARHDPSELVRPAIVMPQTVQRVAVFRIHHRMEVSR